MNPQCIILALALTLAHCAKDQSQVKDFLKRDLAGKINGKPFKVRYAFVDPTADTPDEDDYAFVFLDYRPKGGCPKQETIPASAVSAMVPAPKAKTRKPVRLKVGTSRTLVMQWEGPKGPKAVMARSGKFKVYSVKGDKIKGKMFARRDERNWLNGYFKAQVCDLRDMSDFNGDPMK